MTAHRGTMTFGSLSRDWRVLTALVSGIAIVVAASRGVVAVVGIPAQVTRIETLQTKVLAQHDTMNTTARQLVDIERRSLCLKVNELRHTDWTHCIDPLTVP